MSKKHGPSVASPSRPTKGRSLASNLNPAKHAAVQLAATAALVVLLRRTNSESLASLSTKRTTISHDNDPPGDSGSKLPTDLPQFQVHVNDPPGASAMVE
ncbi:hypothetical protein V6N13_020092 [Hibiscus sabdariffa]